MSNAIGYIASGLAAGTITGILGSGGGLILVPLLAIFCKANAQEVFSQSLGIMLPVCICSLAVQHRYAVTSFSVLLPYLLGGAIGGGCAAVAGRRIPAVWLHRCFGIIMLWSGIRCLFS